MLLRSKLLVYVYSFCFYSQDERWPNAITLPRSIYVPGPLGIDKRLAHGWFFCSLDAGVWTVETSKLALAAPLEPRGSCSWRGIDPFWERAHAAALSAVHWTALTV